MRYMRPIPRRLLPDDMLVWPARGDNTFEAPRLVRHVRMEWAQGSCEEVCHVADAGRGTVFVDAESSEGAFEVPVGSRVLVGRGPSVFVRACRRCCVVRGRVHHWELEVL